MLRELLVAVRSGYVPTVDDVNHGLQAPDDPVVEEAAAPLPEMTQILRLDAPIKPRTAGQRHYVNAIRNHEVVIVVGPAGTGKTFLAMAAAVSALRTKEVSRLVLTRPAVEAGENLGFLPGDLQEKVNPYLRPLYDALHAMVDPDQVRKYFDRDRIEVAPLAFMRGRTLSHCFAILDEAQNTTMAQMKMFLTRLGKGSRAIVTGDITQIDLPPGTKSGLVEAQRILRNTEGVAVVRLGKEDVVRQPIVQNIIEAYDTDEALLTQPSPEPKPEEDQA